MALRSKLPHNIVESLLNTHYTALFLCKGGNVIRPIFIQEETVFLPLAELPLKEWLPKSLIQKSSTQYQGSIDALKNDDLYTITRHPLPPSDSLLDCIISIQQAPLNAPTLLKEPKRASDYQNTLLANSAISLYLLDYETELFIEGLGRYAQLTGYTLEEIEQLESGVYSLVHPDDIPAVKEQEKLLASSEDKVVVPVKFRLQHKSGDLIWVEVYSTIFARDDEGKPLLEMGSIHQIIDVETETLLERQNKYFKALVENSYDCILMYDTEMNISYISPSVTRVTGYESEDIIGKPISSFIYEEDRESAASNIQYVAENPGALSVVERRINHKDGHVLWIESHMVNHLSDADIKGVTVNFHVITERKLAEGKIYNLANYDSLTQLPNRHLFRKRLVKGLADAVKEQSTLALMYIDLDRFKEINDGLGHAVGDSLLQSVSHAIKQCLRNTDTLARVGGDEFTIVLPNTDRAEAELIASRIVNQFRTPFIADRHTVQTGASIGISLFPEHSKRADDLFRFADMAMYSAKHSGGVNQHHFYESKYSDKEDRRRAIERKLKVALANDELQLYYQPRVDINNGMVSSVEALCRWHDKELGDVSPGLFIPIAEETGMVHQLSKQVVKKACEQLVAWRNMGIDTTVALNLSVHDLKNHEIVDIFSDNMQQHGLDGSHLEIEITESAAMTDVVHSVKILNEFKNLGITLSIDDFGKGYSSLAYLTQLPVDSLKIDKHFVLQLGAQNEDRLTNVNIIKSIISLAQSLGLKTVGEGIETAQQHSVLRSLGCELGQGMLFCRPMSAGTVTSVLQKRIITLDNIS